MMSPADLRRRSKGFRVACPAGLAASVAALAFACEESRGPSPGASASAASTFTAAPSASALAEAPALSPSAAAFAEALKKLAPFDPPAPSAGLALAELGKLVFFDRRLSGNDQMSCATCHDPTKGWADGLKTGKGHQGKVLSRNTPTVINVDYRLPLFWDGRAKDAEEQALMPIGNPDEMAQDLDDLAQELQKVPEYVARFRRAFPTEGITKDTLAKALAAFERTLLSAGSPYDRYLAGDRSAMSEEAVRGLELFVGKAACVKCHDGPQLTDNGFHNIGVAGSDPGRYKIVPIALMKGAFKTPGLRDVALTAPYFHDGSAKTLEAVIEHYDRGGVAKDNLDRDIQPLRLSDGERAALVAFLNSLTGKSPNVEPPMLPGAYGKPSRKPLIVLMKQADGMLDTLDKLFASINDQEWGDMRRHCERLIGNVEEIDVTRGRSVPAPRWSEFRAAQGELILALKDLHLAIREKSAGDAHKRYDAVRARCNSCHQGFRPDKDGDKEREKH